MLREGWDVQNVTVKPVLFVMLNSTAEADDVSRDGLVDGGPLRLGRQDFPEPVVFGSH